MLEARSYRATQITSQFSILRLNNYIFFRCEIVAQKEDEEGDEKKKEDEEDQEEDISEGNSKFRMKAVKAKYLSLFEKKPTEEEVRAKEEQKKKEKTETRQYGLWDSVTTKKVLPTSFTVCLSSSARKKILTFCFCIVSSCNFNSSTEVSSPLSFPGEEGVDARRLGPHP